MARSAQVQVQFDGWQEADDFLTQLPRQLRGKALGIAVTKGLNKVKRRAQELVPQPGSPGYTERRGERRNRKHLKDTISVVIREYSNSLVGIVGPSYPTGAAGHLVEHGHRIARGGTLEPLSDAKKKTPGISKVSKERGKGIPIGFVPANPFMQPAWEDTASEFDDIVVDTLENLIQHG